MTPSRVALATFALAAAVSAQVPDGWYAWTAFGSAGRTGIFLQHPRTPGAPVAVEGLNPDLLYVPGGRSGGSSLLVRASDGALIVGERAAVGNSVDLHVIRLHGVQVVFDQLFGMGTAGPAGEIPQAALMPDGRVLVAATDLTQGPLASIPTTNYGMEGIGIVDLNGGAVTPVPVANPGVFLGGVFNGLTLSADGTTAYIANYVSSTIGEVWALPVPAGGTATLLTTVPAGVSNVGLDLDGNLMIVALNGPPNCWRYEFGTAQLSPVVTGTGPLNAIALETTTGNFALCSANAGTPSRSILWMDPQGNATTLVTPGYGTPSGIDARQNPRTFGNATPNADVYVWKLRPNPGGLPLVGNAGFSLTMEASNPSAPAFGGVLIGLAKASSPINIAGVDVLIDPASILYSGSVGVAVTQTIGLGIPADHGLVGAKLYLQGIHLAGGGLLGTNGVEFTIL